MGRILIADDEPAWLRVTAEVLRKAGYDCTTVPDAHEAAKLLSANEYDLLLSDLEMPGNQNLRLIRDVPQIASGLPVILMTAYPTMESAVQSIQLPVTAYLVKPFATEELLTQVRRAVHDRQACHRVRLGHERVKQWEEALRHIETLLSAPRRGETGPWQALFDLTLVNITEALGDLRVFAELLRTHQSGEPSPELLNSAQPLLLVNALRETVAVLEKTKSSFKSKELGDLRKRLQSLVEPQRDSDRPAGP